MKYRNTFRPTALKARTAALVLVLAAALLALPGVAGIFDAARPASAQETARKPSRATKLDELRGTAETARRAQRLAGKRPKADAAASSAQTSALFPCDISGGGTFIGFNQTVNGALSNDDCDFGDNTRFDYYHFDGVAGQQVSIALNSAQFDAYLFLIFDAERNNILSDADLEIGEDDDGGGGSNSRIPSGGGVATLPFTGRYFIIVNAFPPDPPSTTVPTGNYSLTLLGAGGQCAAAAITPGGAPVNGSLGSPDCRFVDDSFFDAYSFTGNAGQRVSISLTTAYSLGGEGVLYLLDASRNIIAVSGGVGGSPGARIPETGLVTLPETGTYFIAVGSTPRDLNNGPASPTGSYTLTVANGGQCPTSAITVGQAVNNSLTTGDCVLPDGTLADFYTFSGTAGQQVAVTLDSAAFDTFLILNGPNGVTIATDDDSGRGPNDTNSRIPGSGFFTLPATGTYTIIANAFAPGMSGAYTLGLSAPGVSASTVQFDIAAFNVTEGVNRSVVVTVTRIGDTTGEARVSYATTDGSASERKDYTAAVGRLRFAPNETSKTFEVVITDDAFAEGAETFTIMLSNAAGATIGTAVATVTINSNDVANGPSPVRDASFNTEFFVRQHYADFLNRVPDAGGLAFWINNIESCGADQQCREARKVDTSAAFFLSIEFQETGFLAVRTHKVAFGNLPGKPVPITLRSFLADSRQIGEGVVVGTPGWPEQLEANKTAYFIEFVQRPDFIAANPLSLTAEQYVDALFARAEVLPTQAERNAAVAAFGAGGTAGRAAALRSVAESQTVKQAETNRAFVLMQYFGYLRRNPDDTDFQNNPDPQFLGYQFWLDKLNQFNGNYVAAEMVKAFIQSIEYGDRFGL